MGCNTCKGKPKVSFDETLKEHKEEKKSTGFKLVEYTSKIIIFLIISAILTPFIIPLLIIVLFKTIVLSQGVDITPLLLHVGKKIFKDDEDEYDEDEEEEDFEEFDQDEYEELNKEDIIVLNNHN
jgi:hypothetical protein